jgi:hypothetical protein
MTAQIRQPRGERRPNDEEPGDPAPGDAVPGDGAAGDGAAGDAAAGDAAPADPPASPLLDLITRRLVESMRVAAQAIRIVEVDVTGIAASASAVGAALDAVLPDALRRYPSLEPFQLSTVEGALLEVPVLRPPLAAVLCAGTPVPRPVVRTGPDGTQTVAVGRLLFLALSYDQRAVAPDDVTGFLSTVRAALTA